MHLKEFISSALDIFTAAGCHFAASKGARRCVWHFFGVHSNYLSNKIWARSSSHKRRQRNCTRKRPSKFRKVNAHVCVWFEYETASWTLTCHTLSNSATPAVSALITLSRLGVLHIKCLIKDTCSSCFDWQLEHCSEICAFLLQCEKLIICSTLRWQRRHRSMLKSSLWLPPTLWHCTV